MKLYEYPLFIFAVAVSLYGLVSTTKFPGEIHAHAQTTGIECPGCGFRTQPANVEDAQTTTATASMVFTLTGGGSASLWRADATCNGASAFVQIATLGTSGYTDTQPADGKPHCYYAMRDGNVPTNEWEWTTPTPSVTSSKNAQLDLTGTPSQ